MKDQASIPAACDTPTSGAAVQGKSKPRKRANMHDGIAVWCDCCSCAAEPYWLAVAEELGIDLGSDYEDEDEDTQSMPNA